jgi:hypothetical protein
MGRGAPGRGAAWGWGPRGAGAPRGAGRPRREEDREGRGLTTNTMNGGNCSSTVIQASARREWERRKREKGKGRFLLS